MQNLRSRNSGLALVIVFATSSLANFFPQGTRPIDGQLGIDADGKIQGILRCDPESISGMRVSIGLAIGSFASEAAEDAAISQGLNGSQNFKVVSLSSSMNTIDLSAPWKPGVVLPTAEKATLVVRSVDLKTNTPLITRNRLVQGMSMVLQARTTPRTPDGQVITSPTFSADPPRLGPLTRTLPIDAEVGMDSAGRLIGSATPLRNATNVFIGFSPGAGQSLEEAIRRIKNGIDGYVPFTNVTQGLRMGGLARKLTTPDGTTSTPGGTYVVKRTSSDYPDEYSFVNVLADGSKKVVPVNKPTTFEGSEPARSDTWADNFEDLRTRTLPIDGVASIAEPLTPGTLTGTVTFVPKRSKQNKATSTYWVGFAPDIDTSKNNAISAINKSGSWVQLQGNKPFDLKDLQAKVCRVGTLILREIVSEPDKKDKLHYADTYLNQHLEKGVNNKAD